MTRDEIRNRNMGKVLAKFELDTEEQAYEILNKMPCEYREDFKAKWGIDESANYCHNYTMLAKKLKCKYEQAIRRQLRAEKYFFRLKEFSKVYEFKECDKEWFEKANCYDLLLIELFNNKIPNDFKIKKIEDVMDKMDNILEKTLTANEKILLRYQYGLDDGKYKLFIEVARTMDLTKSFVSRTIREAVSKLRTPEKLEELKN